MREILRIIYYLPNYIFAKIISIFLYEKKYLKCKYFYDKPTNITAVGWNWITKDFFGRLLFRKNLRVPFPVSPFIMITGHKNIQFNVDDLNIFQNHGNYFQTFGDSKIIIGKGTWIAPNVGIITTNHDQNDLSRHLKGENIIIGDNCWIGMNSVILPGVELGEKTIVGAGSVVSKSFKNGNCVIAGKPAVVINRIVKKEN